MEIDDAVEPFSAKERGQLNIVAQAGEAARTFDHDDRIEIGMVPDHRLGRRFHEIGEMRVGEAAPQGADRGRGEYHVADQAQPDKQNLQGWLYGSTVASSINITGMSSLIGYTR